MVYKREELTKKKAPEEEQIVSQTLINLLAEGKHLSVAEARHICGQLRLWRKEGSNESIDALQFDQCDDMIFINKYLLYFNKHEVWFDIEDFNGPVPLDQKKLDITFLDRHFQAWENDVISNLRLSDEKLRHVSIETNRQIKALKAYCTRRGLGYNRFKHLRKGLILHSKFLYFTMLEYYEEGYNGEESIEICNNRFVIDSFVYVHVLFRHYAEMVKEHQVGKSYHSIDHFDYRYIPKQIIEVLTHFATFANCQKFDMEKIFFELNGQLFALWFKEVDRQKKGKPKEKVLQIQTLYPVVEQRDLDKIATLNRTQANENTFFFL
jgi:hypothetical protein